MLFRLQHSALLKARQRCKFKADEALYPADTRVHKRGVYETGARVASLLPVAEKFCQALEGARSGGYGPAGEFFSSLGMSCSHPGAILNWDTSGHQNWSNSFCCGATSEGEGNPH